jgi:hypothetical protein
MVETLTAWFWLGAAAYATVGIFFAVVFVNRGANRMDPSARDGSWGFRAAILPATAALWPLLAIKLRGKVEPGQPANPEAPVSPRRQRLLHGMLIAILGLATAFAGIKALSSREAAPQSVVKIP